ncbi:MAG: sugar phosphate isomerase/epimerase [Chloroflexi bacterium]|nr:sugar phosphate isomerase/epimerase [Chloroflexota bacterium]
MRLGGPVFSDYQSPEDWVHAVQALGYGAAYCPVDSTADEDTIRAYADAAAKADIVIAEVGCWSNPLSADENIRQSALEKCKQGLALADRIGARCAVNIPGSCSDRWDGPHPSNYSDETFDRIVETTREIIDAVRPTRSFYTLETMPWMPPDSVTSYLDLLRAIDRPALAVHLDPVNLVTSPRIYYNTSALVRQFIDKLGPYIKSCHAKDLHLSGEWVVHMEEVRPGLGGFNYAAYLKALTRLDPDIPLMLEHLPDAATYDLAAAHVRDVAARVGVTL